MLIQLVVCVVEAPSNILDHFFILFPLPEVDSEPFLDFLDLFLFIIFLYFFIEISGLFDGVEEHLLLGFVHLFHIFLGNLMVEDSIAFVFSEEDV